MAKKDFILEDNFDKVAKRISKAPLKLLNIIGGTLIKEIRPTLKNFYTDRKGQRLSKSLSYKVFDEEGELQIGFKMFYAPFVMDRGKEPLTPIVEKNKDIIAQLIADELDKIGGE